MQNLNKISPSPWILNDRPYPPPPEKPAVPNITQWWH